MFIDVVEDNNKAQIFATAEKTKGNFKYLNKALRRGDIIGFEDVPGRKRTGELSICPERVKLLSPSLTRSKQRW